MAQTDSGPPHYVPWDPIEAEWSRIWAAKDRREAAAHNRRPRKLEDHEQEDLTRQARKEAWEESPSGRVSGGGDGDGGGVVRKRS